MCPSDKNSSKYCVLFPQLFHFSLKKICAKFASATTKNAGQNACFCIAFSIKTHCI